MNNDESSRRARHLADAVRCLSGQRRVVLQKRLGQAAVAQAQLGVRGGRDPYGNPWAPLTSRTGGPLRRTGNNIQRSWTAGGEDPESFRFGSRFKYLETHQYGAVIKPKHRKGLLRFQVESVRRGRAITRFAYARQVTIPRRQLVPENDTGGLGKRWFGAFSRTVRRYLIEVFTKAGVA